MKVLAISPEEQKACWLILASIYHLGAAGATKGNGPVTQNALGAPTHLCCLFLSHVLCLNIQLYQTTFPHPHTWFDMYSVSVLHTRAD